MRLALTAGVLIAGGFAAGFAALSQMGEPSGPPHFTIHFKGESYVVESKPELDRELRYKH